MYIVALLVIITILIVCTCTRSVPPVVQETLLRVFLRSECMVVSRVDGLPYKVREDFRNKQEASNILGEINRMYVRIIKHLKKTKMNTKWANDISFLASNYNPDVLGEHIPWNTNYTSYVRDKGRIIRLCLRTQKNRKKFHDMTTLKFVAIHELSHMMTRSYGHEDEFWEAFSFILKEANRIGEIDLIRYSRTPAPYCGILITSNPAFD